MAKGIKLTGVEATLYQPTDAHPWWKIAYIDSTTRKRRTTSGGLTAEEAEAKARALCGEFVDGYGEAPTLAEVTNDWLATNQSQWSSRTYDHYSYFVQKFLTLYGERSITRVSPVDVSKVDLANLSRGEQEKARTVLRGILNHGSAWFKHDAKKIESIVKGIKLSGNATGKRNPRVSENDIPTSGLVAAIIITATHTLQVGPLNELLDSENREHDQTATAAPKQTLFDPITGNKTLGTEWRSNHSGSGMTEPLEDVFRLGMPRVYEEQNLKGEWVNRGTDARRRGIPKHYGDPDGRRKAETFELASRYRQIGLATALGAGGGLRIGELLALRVRHFLSPAQVTYWLTKEQRMGGDAIAQEEQRNELQRGIAIPAPIVEENRQRWRADNDRNAFRGVLDVSEQASQASKGKIWITGTKGLTKQRTVHLPAFLPNWNGFGIGTHRPAIAKIVPRFEDETISLWDATEEEAIKLWGEGFTPLSLLLWQRLAELWNDPAINKLNDARRAKEFRELLLFPTRNKARAGRDGTSNVQIDPNWRKSIRIVDGAGTYQGQSNYAQDVNALYDYVSEQFDEWPEHRTNVATRKGWTHHGLRHWAVSTRIKAGVPLPLIAKEMGHADSAFTLERYGHVLDKGVEHKGFEY